MNIATLARQTSAGAIVGLSAVIYSISYGALLFSGPLVGYVGFGITVALITAIIGALFGLFSEEGTFISGPDSNTISVMAGTMAALGSLGLSQASSLGLRLDASPVSLGAAGQAGSANLDLAMEAIFVTTFVCALAFYALPRLKLSGLVRYIPFSVMAGFLASTGWLMCSGALNIISETPLTMAGLNKLIANPYRPELLFGIAVVATLYSLASRISSALLIPLVMVVATVAANLGLASELCDPVWCRREDWFFAGLQDMAWQPPWELDFSVAHLKILLQHLPSMLVVSFVGLLTILLSLASLELNYQKEFDLDHVLKTHAASAGVAAMLGGFVGIISIGRTTLNQKVGGGAAAGVIAALICMAVLFGAGGAIAYVPKAALGGLVLYLGLNMIKQWLWDQRHVASRLELAQIALILGLVANYGYLVGFGAGLVLACVIFVVTYSRFPLTSLVTDLSLLSSSVVRASHQVEAIRASGHKTVIYRLSGYVFFGSASKIDLMFQGMDIDQLEGVVLDFSDASGVDRSAIGVFQRILRRYSDRPLQFYFVHSRSNRDDLLSISLDVAASKNIHYFPSLDRALEAAEEALISKGDKDHVEDSCFEFLPDDADRETFLGYCEARQVSKDEALCHDGDLSDAIYFVDDGSFDIIKIIGDARLRLAKLSKGAMVGEMAFYTGGARTASILAVVQSSVYILHKDSLVRMRSEHPALATSFDRMVICKLAGSLARTNKLIATLS
jgi:SulP family sulfate permease